MGRLVLEPTNAQIALKNMPTQILPIPDVPLLLVEGETRVLVAADLHLGLEYELWLGGAAIPSQTKRLEERLLSHIKKCRPERLVLLGDVKHNVPKTSWQEKREIPSFLNVLSEVVAIDVVPGNHDGGIAYLLPEEASLMPRGGYILDGVGYFHGHTWPRKSLFQAEILVAGHLHPAVRLTDPLGYSVSERAWARCPTSATTLRYHYGEDLPTPELIVVPAFNDLCGGLPLNALKGEDQGPLPKMTDMEEAGIYLLDGTDLGRLKGITSQKRGRGSRLRASRGREASGKRLYPRQGSPHQEMNHER